MVRKSGIDSHETGAAKCVVGAVNHAGSLHDCWLGTIRRFALHFRGWLRIQNLLFRSISEQLQKTRNALRVRVPGERGS